MKKILLIACCLLSGCVTVPSTSSSIGGSGYLPLITLCQRQGFSWDYDTFSRTISLNKDGHKINLMVGERLAVVDERNVYLKSAVDIRDGVIVVPYRFKEEVLDPLLRKDYGVTGKLNFRKIVIDAGHGGKDPGASGRTTGLREKFVTLDIAKRLKKILENDGVTVVLTRSSDNFVSLERRVVIANSSRADLFISIHANANRVRSLSGFEVYYVRSDDAQRALSAAKNIPLDLDKNCFANESLNLKAILWDMIYNYNRGQAIGLAQSFCRTVEHDLDTPILGVKNAGFYVLKGARMPAVLVELGFLSNYNEEKLLRNTFYRQQLTEALAKGLKDYSQSYTFREVKR